MPDRRDGPARVAGAAPAQESSPGQLPIPRGVKIVTRSAASTGATSPSSRRCPLRTRPRRSRRRRSRRPARSVWPAVRPTRWRCCRRGGHLTGSTSAKIPWRTGSGLADPKFKVVMNLYGALAMIPLSREVSPAIYRWRERDRDDALARTIRRSWRTWARIAGPSGRRSDCPELRQVDGRGNGRDLAVYRQRNFGRRPYAEQEAIVSFRRISPTALQGDVAGR